MARPNTRRSSRLAADAEAADTQPTAQPDSDEAPITAEPIVALQVSFVLWAYRLAHLLTSVNEPRCMCPTW